MFNMAYPIRQLQHRQHHQKPNRQMHHQRMKVPKKQFQITCSGEVDHRIKILIGTVVVAAVCRDKYSAQTTRANDVQFDNKG
jgi:hypothetical protein